MLGEAHVRWLPRCGTHRIKTSASVNTVRTLHGNASATEAISYHLARVPALESICKTLICQRCGGLRYMLRTLTFCSEAAPHYCKLKSESPGIAYM